MFKKILCLTLAVVMALSMIACKKEGSTGGGSVANNEGALCDEYTVLTAFYNQNKHTDDGSYQLFKDAAEITNVGLECTIPKSNSDFFQAFNLMVASGDMPDIIQTYNAIDFNQLGAEGAFVPLNEYFDEYMPNVKKILDENPQVKENITAFDGNIYYLPFMPGGTASAGWFIRQDWLDKLNLKVPVGAEELYDVLTAFRNDDPNGNGQKDEVPLFGKTVVDELMPLWNARPDWYIDNGVIKYGPYEENYKTAMINIVKWYKEGLIDQEVFTRSDNPRAKLLGNNLGGACVEWFGSTAAFNDTLAETVPGIKFLPMAPPSGVVLQRRPINDVYGWGVSASSENIELAVRYLDFWFSEAGNRLMNFGKEGVHYDMVDGKPQFKEGLDVQTVLDEYGAQLDIGFQQDFAYERQWINDVAYEGMMMYVDNDYFVEQLPNVATSMTKDEIDEYSKLKTDIDTYADEMMQKWILGSVDVEKNWDEYVSRLESFGIKRLTELQQAAYDRR